MDENSSLDSWKGVVDNYLKAENLEGTNGFFIVEDVKIVSRTNDSGETRPTLQITTTVNEKEYLFQLNYTNAKIVKDKVDSPKKLLGRRMYWEKIKVRNPSTNKTQDGISITDIQ